MTTTILIVDDYGAMRSLVRRILAHRWPDVRFVESGTAEDALARVERDVPDAVIMDVELPGMNGIDATREIAARHPACNVIVHTASDETWCETEAQAAGARCFVRKGDCEGLAAAASFACAARACAA